MIRKLEKRSSGFADSSTIEHQAEEKTTGGLFVPAAATEKPREGMIVAVGPGRTHQDSGVLMPTQLSAGDVVARPPGLICAPLMYSLVKNDGHK